MNTLIVFDIDGTLLQSVAPHQRAFVGALKDCGLDDIDSAWGGYAHHTDSWIFREVFRRNTGALPLQEQMEFFSARLHERFLAAAEDDGVEQVPGAAEFLKRLGTMPDFTVSFATGGMRAITTAKLAPFDVQGPVATASDHTFREHVVREAIHQAGGPFDRVVAVGDGPWDVRAAVATGSQFIGIGETDASFGDWFPRTHLFRSFDDIDPTVDFTFAPPPDRIAAAPATDGQFNPRPWECHCWS